MVQLKRSSLNREDALKYIEATLLGGMTKKDAYLAHINPNVKNPNQAITVMENKKDFIDLYQMVFSDDVLKIQHAAKRVQSKYVNLMEKNIDTAVVVLEEVNKKESTMSEKVIGIKLVNETLSAMSVVVNSGIAPGDQARPKLNRGSVVQ